jgi:hypothetical protein
MMLFAILLALVQTATHLAVEPWTGSDFQVTSGAAAKYRLEVNGKPNDSIRLSARRVAPGWLAAFCTPKLCSPQRVDVALPRSGQAVFQFELIRQAAGAPKRSGATITGSDGASVSVPEAYRE